MPVRVDYRGQVAGTATEQRFPNQVRSALPLEYGVVVVLDPHSGGVSNPTYQYERGENLVGIDSGGHIVWRGASVSDTDNTLFSYRQIWRVNSRLLAQVTASNTTGSMFVEWILIPVRSSP